MRTIAVKLSKLRKKTSVFFSCIFSIFFLQTNFAFSEEMIGYLSCIVREQTVLGVNEGESTFYPNFFKEGQIVELDYIYTDDAEIVVELKTIDLIYLGLPNELKTLTDDVAVFKSLAEKVSFGREYIRADSPTSEIIFKRYLSETKNKYFWDGYLAVDIGGNGVIKSLTTLNCFDASDLVDSIFEQIVRDQTT